MDPQDTSYTSRKFLMCSVAGLIIVGVGLLAGTVMPGVAGIMPEIIGGILGACGLFISGNVATRYFVSKANPGASFQGELADPPKVAPKPPVKPVAGKKLPVQPDAPEDLA